MKKGQIVRVDKEKYLNSINVSVSVSSVSPINSVLVIDSLLFLDISITKIRFSNAMLNYRNPHLAMEKLT